MFPAAIRTAGLGVPYGVAVSAFGGTAEYIARWFMQAGNESGFYWCATAVIACTLLVYLGMRDTQKHLQIDAKERG